MLGQGGEETEPLEQAAGVEVVVARGALEGGELPCRVRVRVRVRVRIRVRVRVRARVRARVRVTTLTLTLTCRVVYGCIADGTLGRLGSVGHAPTVPRREQRLQKG